MSEAAPPILSADSLNALPAGTRVAEFEVRRVLGAGGFGIVYLAWDHALEREVALKEYMPGTLAGRGTGLQVSVRSSSTADTFALGLRSFINEARLLARFDHPSLVKVYRFWEDNGTAYMVMPHYVGRTLRQARMGMVVPPGEGACRRVLDALLSALETLHREGVYHRDIAPDNVLLGDDGLPVLLDFGAARRVLGDRTQALTSIMKPHYAPLEQYADGNVMRQGPWTDLYSLGGTMYFRITGEVPVAAASRALHDDQPRLTITGARDCSPGLLAAIDWMLALKPPERPQSVHMLRDVLEGRITMPGRLTADKTAPGVAARDAAPPPASTTDIDLSSGYDEAADAQAASELAAVTVLQAAPAIAPPVPSLQLAASAVLAVRRSTTVLSWLLGALLLLNLLAWWWFTRPTVVAPVVAPVAQARVPQEATPADPAASETILSIMPARSAMPRPAASVAANIAVPRSASAAVPAAAAKPRIAAEGAASAVASTAATASALGPRERCGDRMFLTMLICMKRECEQPALRSHPECVKMREQEATQRDRHQ